MEDRSSVGGGASVAMVARGSLATLAAYRHDPVLPHHDPDEEIFHRSTVVFTTSGSWGIRGDDGYARADPSVVILGVAGRAYRASHDEAIPSDRTMFLEIAEHDEGAAFGLDTAELFDRVFSRQAVACTRGIARLQVALATPTPHEAFGSLRMDVLTMELLIELAGATPPVHGAPTPRPDVRERVVRAREYLDEHLSEDVDLRTLAREVLLSPFHLARLFRQEVGESPHRYLVHRRLDRAAELLASTPLSVTQVSERVGFGSPAHFGQAFRRRFGVPPSVYRSLAP